MVILWYLKNYFILKMDNIRSILLVKNIFIFKLLAKKMLSELTKNIESLNNEMFF